MKEKNNISLELLLLNDLLKTNVIDETIYNLAANKIRAMKRIANDTENPRVLATA